MKPPFLATTTLLSRIGSPAATGLRTIAPTKSLMASGRSDFLMKLELAASAGQVCQPTSRSPTTWPTPRSDLATSTSTVASGGGAGAGFGGSGARVPLAQPGGNAAGEESDTEYDQARRFHYASLPW